nr:hypothetical protein [Tanacetum cinerariifolium]
MDAAESSALKRSTVIRFHIPQRRSTCLTSPTLVPTVDNVDEMIEEQEARENVELVNEHLAYVEIKKMVEGQENIIDDKEEEITDKVYELERREKGKIVEESRNTPFPTPIRSPRIYTDLELKGRYGYLFEHLRARFMPKKSFATLVDHLKELMVDSLPTMVKKHYRSKFKSNFLSSSITNNLYSRTTISTVSFYERRSSVAATRHINMASTLDEVWDTSASFTIMEEVSLNIDESKIKKIADEMLRQRCTSGDEHQYHIDQMKNFLKSDIVWESRKEILVSLHPRKTTPLVQSCQRDPEAPALPLINQDLFYLKIGSLGPKKIVLSLHKFLAVIFNDDDIEEQTFRWVNKCVKKFNPYARYGFEH